MTIQYTYDVSANPLPSPVIHTKFAPPFWDWQPLPQDHPLPEGGCYVVDVQNGFQAMLKIGSERYYVQR